MRARFSSFLVVLALATRSFAQTPPPNDDFADRTLLTGCSITFTGTLAGATLENQETSNSFPRPMTSGASVWWTWAAPDSTRAVIAIVRDSPPYLTNADLQVFAGTDLNTLTVVDENSFGDPPGRYVSFDTTIGTSYQIRVAGGSNGRYVGGTFALNLIATNPPVFISQPKDCVVSPYGSAFFGAIASGPATTNSTNPSPTSYQWYFKGTPIAGQTCPSLLVHYATPAQAGTYSVIASNIGGVMESAPAVLTVADTNPIARLTPLRSHNPSLLSFSVTAEAARWYKLESSPDLKTWINPVWLQLTNSTSLFTIPGLGSAHYVRASFDIFTDMCVAQLKQYHWAGYMTLIERRQPPSFNAGFNELRPYVPLLPGGNFPCCPAGGTYAIGGQILTSPTCSLSSRGHVVQPLP